MKIDPLGRFLEGKTNGSYAFMVDMAEKSGNKLTKTADKEKITQKPGVGRKFLVRDVCISVLLHKMKFDKSLII